MTSMYNYLTEWHNEICRLRMLFNKIEKGNTNMLKTYVNLHLGGKDLNCELEYYNNIDNLEIKLIKVEMVIDVITDTFEKPSSVKHTKDITEFLEVTSNEFYEYIENECVDVIKERGYI